MFKLTLQIGLYDLDLVKKEDYFIKSGLIYSKQFFFYDLKPQPFQNKESLYGFETMF